LSEKKLMNPGLLVPGSSLGWLLFLMLPNVDD